MLCKEHGATVFGVCMAYDIILLSGNKIMRYNSTPTTVTHVMVTLDFTFAHDRLSCNKQLFKFRSADYFPSTKACTVQMTMHRGILYYTSALPR